MATNPHVNWQTAENEQDLLHNLTKEFIKFWGIDCKYLPRTLQIEDIIFGEDTISKFDTTYDVEMYVETYDDFGGDQEMFAKFGLEIRDRIDLAINPREFTTLTGMDKPLEGDLIYFPFNKGLFEISYVSQEHSSFFPSGTVAHYKLQAELFQYSQEDLNTGIPDIDSLETASGGVVTTYGNYLQGAEPPVGTADWIKNTTYAIGDTIIPTNAGGQWTGLYYEATAVSGMNMTGVSEPTWPKTSGASITDHEITWEAKGWNTETDAIEYQADEVLDFSETNPFGSIS